MTNKPSVALIGAGSMGGALMKGWLAAGTIDASRSAVFDPGVNDDMNALCEKHGVGVNPDIKSGFDAVVIAVKPQMADSALPAYAPLAQNAIAISVMAGTSIAKAATALGGAAQVARAMPNLPAAIGRGVSGLYAPETINEEGRDLIEKLMRAAGDVVWVESEKDIDAVTAVSGSGPAYFFLLTEALADAGEAAGLDRSAAASLARATLAGAGALIDVETRSPSQMRKAVTSPGGTTEAALQILDGEDGALRKLVKEAVAAAARRAAELTK
ncbi:pyrroline-5-carboxylate reductase [Hyphococcus sp.]|uniref:pyrroline-5-carboxylate reductase n=1 Tax=Hyphococcus sp. TaxID=2038636 RepID=UPI003CCC0B1F